ncbi:TonB-dependent receptor [Bradyrhizobium symbiodeficiens]|uniref:TonB-dependent receptor n=1 Tax=Bradyrhizobium symbiodeficiens TaxID=1404367 RepID=UPI000BA1B3B4|nr:TonB-dependent siderophore receptor [Bradyrhizobium symbiodeficiens]AWM06788.1 TonB-dependent siderophore receptor [Bradyrhizobium symbiodeficiens]
MVVAGQARSRFTAACALLMKDLLGMLRAGGVGTVARFAAALLGGVALLTWFELPARSQTSQGGSSLPPVTVEAPTKPSARRAPTRRNDARVRSTSRRAPQAQTVTVQSQPGVVPAFAGGQVAQGARLGMLGNTNTMKSPFSVTSYTDKFIRDQQAATGADALILDPSVRSSHPTGGIVESFNIRGFPINEGNNGEFAFEGLYGIAPTYRIFTDYVERIEVLKGPSAALSGMAPNGGVGGVINVVPKRAEEDLTRLTASYGSTARFGGHWDVARRYGDGKEWGVRASGGLRGGDTPIDRQSETTGVGSLALDYRGERFRSWLYLIAQTDRFDAPSRPFLMAPGLQVPKAPDGRLNVTQPWEWSRINDQSALLRTEYDVSDQVTLFADVGGAKTNVERFFGLPTIVNTSGDTTSTPQYFGLSIDRTTYDGGFRARFDTGFVHHALAVQASVYQDALYRRLTNGSPVTSNVYNPTVAPTQFANEISDRPRLSDSELTGLSIADTLSVLDERVLLTLGVRRQGIEANNYLSNIGTLTSSYDKSAVTPVVGLVVRPLEHVSLYANYVEGLARGDVAPQTASNFGEVLQPYVAKQYEAGVKVEFGRIATTFSAFEISKASGELSAGRFAATGEQRVRGLEFNVYGELMPDVRVLGGISLLDGTLTKTAVAANVGNTPIGVPNIQANIGMEWDLPWMRNLTLNGAVIYTGRQFVDAANKQPIPEWTRLDLGARYTTAISGRKTVFRANIQNVTGESYWSSVASFGTFFLGAPRTYLLSMTVDM